MKTLYKIMVLILLLSLLITSCTPAATPTPETIIITKVVEKEGQTVIETVEITSTPVPQVKPDKVTIWSPCGAETVADWNYDPILQAVEQATNTDIEMVNVDWGGFMDQLNAGFASGQAPDIIGIVGPDQRGTLEKWAAEGAIAPFEGAVAEAAPNVLAEYQNDPSLAEMKIDGKIYFQPVGWGNGTYPNMGIIHVRKDLLDKYNMQPPDTFEQYFDYVKTCQQNGDGKGIVFGGETGVGPAINAFAGAFGAPMRGWVKKDSGYEYWATQDGVKQGLLLFRQMVAEGLVDPAVWEMSGDNARAQYVSGGACSYIFNGGGHTGRIQNDMTLVNPSFQEWILPALDAGKGFRGYTSEEMFWGTSQLGGLKTNNPTAAARVINFLISEEGYKLTAVGIEGRDYEVQDGNIVLLPQRIKDGFPTEAGDTGAHPLASCIVSWVPQEWQNWQLMYGKDQAYKDWFEQMWANQGKYQIPTYGLLTTSPLWNDFQATSNDLVNIAFLEIVKATSADAAAARFDQFVKDWLAAGGQAAQNEMSQTLSELYK